jgi:hypothetical protein
VTLALLLTALALFGLRMWFEGRTHRRTQHAAFWRTWWLMDADPDTDRRLADNERGRAA